MNYRRPAVSCCALCALAWAVCADSSPAHAAVRVPVGNQVAGRQPDTVGGYSSGNILIKLTRSAQDRAIAERKALRMMGKASNVNGKRPDALPWMSDTVCAEAARWNATEITPLVDWEFANPELARKFGFDCLYVVHVPAGTDTPRAARAFCACGNDVAVATIDPIGTVAGIIPNDTHFDRLWGLRNTSSNLGASGGVPGADIDAPGAWDVHTGAAGDVIIAIIDTGINGIHPDLTNVIAGRNTHSSAPTDLTTDACSHGTHVAGTAAATGNNGKGVVGVSWGAKLMPVRITSAFAPCLPSFDALIAGIIWAADNGADVANMSVTFDGLSPVDVVDLQNAIDYGRNLGMISIAATGNSNFPCTDLGGVCYPAHLPRCVAVGATTTTDLPASFANKGVEMDVAAPGDLIYSTCIAGGVINQSCDCFPGQFYPGCDQYAYLSGTSMATPHVSGLAALLKSFDPSFSVSDLEDIITTTAEEANNGVPGWDEAVGYGRINAHTALLAAQVWPTILSSFPANGAIDARQHTDQFGTQEFGVSHVDMDFPPDVAPLLTVDDFLVLQKGGDFAPPVITELRRSDLDTVRVALSAMIEPLAWTTIAHHTTGIVRIGFLPGDTNADQLVNSDDAVALANHFLGVGDPLPEWSTDLDWSGATSPTDFLTLVDLLHGADLHEKASGTTLP